MLFKSAVLVIAAILTANAAIVRDSVALSKDTGFLFTQDVLAPNIGAAGSFDIGLPGGPCTLSCPGTCITDVVSPRRLYVLKVPMDSIVTMDKVDTTNVSLVGKPDSVYAIVDQDAYSAGKPWPAFLLKTTDDKWALCLIASFEVVPDNSHGTCMGYQIAKIHFSFVLQTDGTVSFKLPSSAQGLTANSIPGVSRNDIAVRRVSEKEIGFSVNKAASSLDIFDLHGQLLERLSVTGGNASWRHARGTGRYFAKAIYENSQSIKGFNVIR